MFSDKTRLTCLAIVKIFETSKPFGDYTAVAVLNDGAGISYGTSQFTHKSGSLHAVLKRFVRLGGKLPGSVLDAMADFAAGARIAKWSKDAAVKGALKRLGRDPLMQQAQREIAFENYLRPALKACEGSDFVLPLSLAVIYDSMNHGSYAKIRDKVQVQKPGNGSMKPIEFEKEWITQYVRKRDAWLESIPRLKATDYRTDFFLAQIARGNWMLRLPMNVHGHQLTDAIFEGLADTDAPDLESSTADPEGDAQPLTADVVGTTVQADTDPTANGQPSTQGEEDVKPTLTDRLADRLSGWQEKLDKVTSFGNSLSPISGSSKVTVLTTKIGGYFLMALGVLLDKWYLVVGLAMIGFALWYLTRSKDRAVMRDAPVPVQQKQTVEVNNA